MATAPDAPPEAAEPMPAVEPPAHEGEATQDDAAAAQTATTADGDDSAPADDSGDVPDGDGGDAAGDGAMPYAFGMQGGPPAFGLPDAYLPPWLQGAEGMPMPFAPFSPPYYYQGPYMDVAEAYDAAAAAAQGGYVGAGAFALPPSPLLTPSMLGALSLSPMGTMSPTSPHTGAVPMPQLYAMPDGGASFDAAAAAAALAQFQSFQQQMMSPRGFAAPGPYALAPQMYDGYEYEAGDAGPSPRQHEGQHGTGGRGRGAAARTGRSGMMVPPPREAAAGAPAGASPPSPHAAEAERMRAGAGAAASSAAAVSAAAPDGGSMQRPRRMGVSAGDVLSETSRGPRGLRGVSPPQADSSAAAAPVAAAPSEDTAVAAAAAALVAASSEPSDQAAAISSSSEAAAAVPIPLPVPASVPEAPVDVAALLSCRSLYPLPTAARFFVVKSYSEDDVHKAIKYGCWSSTPAGNKRLDAAFRDCSAQQPPQPVLLLFSVNASGQFCGVAQLASRVDAAASAPFWQQSAKWAGRAELRWHAVKDVPNAALRHVSVGTPPGVTPTSSSPAAAEALATAAAKPLTNSRDTQELSFAAGLEALRIIRDYPSKTSLLGDFQWYGEREAERERLRAIGAIAGGTAAATPTTPQPATEK